MKKYIQTTQKNVKNLFYLLNYKEGLDPEYDEACESAFLKFLDFIYYLLVGSYILMTLLTSYFLITDVLMR